MMVGVWGDDEWNHGGRWGRREEKKRRGGLLMVMKGSLQVLLYIFHLLLIIYKR